MIPENGTLSKQVLYRLGRFASIFSHIALDPVAGKLGEDSWGSIYVGWGLLKV